VRQLVPGRLAPWLRGAGLTCVFVLVWAVLIPAGYVWTGLVALVGTFALAIVFATRSFDRLTARAEAVPSRGARGARGESGLPDRASGDAATTGIGVPARAGGRGAIGSAIGLGE
jgi:hypothetical protein